MLAGKKTKKSAELTAKDFIKGRLSPREAVVKTHDMGAGEATRTSQADVNTNDVIVTPISLQSEIIASENGSLTLPFRSFQLSSQHMQPQSLSINEPTPHTSRSMPNTPNSIGMARIRARTRSQDQEHTSNDECEVVDESSWRYAKTCDVSFRCPPSFTPTEADAGRNYEVSISHPFFPSSPSCTSPVSLNSQVSNFSTTGSDLLLFGFKDETYRDFIRKDKFEGCEAGETTHSVLKNTSRLENYNNEEGLIQEARCIEVNTRDQAALIPNSPLTSPSFSPKNSANRKNQSGNYTIDLIESSKISLVQNRETHQPMPIQGFIPIVPPTSLQDTSKIVPRISQLDEIRPLELESGALLLHGTTHQSKEKYLGPFATPLPRIPLRTPRLASDPLDIAGRKRRKQEKEKILEEVRKMSVKKQSLATTQSLNQTNSQRAWPRELEERKALQRGLYVTPLETIPEKKYYQDQGYLPPLHSQDETALMSSTDAKPFVSPNVVPYTLYQQNQMKNTEKAIFTEGKCGEKDRLHDGSLGTSTVSIANPLFSHLPLENILAVSPEELDHNKARERAILDALKSVEKIDELDENLRAASNEREVQKNSIKNRPVVTAFSHDELCSQMPLSTPSYGLFPSTFVTASVTTTSITSLMTPCGTSAHLLGTTPFPSSLLPSSSSFSLSTTPSLPFSSGCGDFASMKRFACVFGECLLEALAFRMKSMQSSVRFYLTSPFGRKLLFYDILAGVFLAARVITLCVAYSVVSGLPVSHCLLTAAIFSGLAVLFWSQAMFTLTAPLLVAGVLIKSEIEKSSFFERESAVSHQALIGSALFLSGIIQLILSRWPAGMRSLRKIVPAAFFPGFVHACAGVVLASLFRSLFVCGTPELESGSMRDNEAGISVLLQLGSAQTCSSENKIFIMHPALTSHFGAVSLSLTLLGVISVFFTIASINFIANVAKLSCCLRKKEPIEEVTDPPNDSSIHDFRSRANSLSLYGEDFEERSSPKDTKPAAAGQKQDDVKEENQDIDRVLFAMPLVAPLLSLVLCSLIFMTVTLRLGDDLSYHSLSLRDLEKGIDGSLGTYLRSLVLFPADLSPQPLYPSLFSMPAFTYIFSSFSSLTWVVRLGALIALESTLTHLASLNYLGKTATLRTDKLHLIAPSIDETDAPERCLATRHSELRLFHARNFVQTARANQFLTGMGHVLASFMGQAGGGGMPKENVYNAQYYIKHNSRHFIQNVSLFASLFAAFSLFIIPGREINGEQQSLGRLITGKIPASVAIGLVLHFCLNTFWWGSLRAIWSKKRLEIGVVEITTLFVMFCVALAGSFLLSIITGLMLSIALTHLRKEKVGMVVEREVEIVAVPSYKIGNLQGTTKESPHKFFFASNADIQPRLGEIQRKPCLATTYFFSGVFRPDVFLASLDVEWDIHEHRNINIQQDKARGDIDINVGATINGTNSMNHQNIPSQVGFQNNASIPVIFDFDRCVVDTLRNATGENSAASQGQEPSRSTSTSAESEKYRRNGAFSTSTSSTDIFMDTLIQSLRRYQTAKLDVVLRNIDFISFVAANSGGNNEEIEQRAAVPVPLLRQNKGCKNMGKSDEKRNGNDQDLGEEEEEKNGVEKGECKENIVVKHFRTSLDRKSRLALKSPSLPQCFSQRDLFVDDVGNYFSIRVHPLLKKCEIEFPDLVFVMDQSTILCAFSLEKNQEAVRPEQAASGVPEKKRVPNNKRVRLFGQEKTSRMTDIELVVTTEKRLHSAVGEL